LNKSEGVVSFCGLAIAKHVPDDREHGDQDHEHDDAVADAVQVSPLQVSRLKVWPLKNIYEKTHSSPAAPPLIR
jgi:hypothetical protein